ncbi:hypothetical protein BLA60_40290 [Actinophytocola xinjiangensis]|uniref:Uncharacterized protein n=1 Tax=Actinophytocola xinjiangensis TaxID=485602 RepID=A0A7Z1AUT3_9PSEU|nr:hypothetical protein [Actinophytocola xinjiangensis]OLF04533.1 hypothetical protein BLA60_40290 [Actinophytocola xinjiangensis]
MTSPQPGTQYDDPGRGFSDVATLDPEEFPEEEAGIVLGAAETIDMMCSVQGAFTAAAQAMIDTVRALLGDFETAQALALAWGAAQEPALQAGTDLLNGQARVEVYWQGGAMDGFNAYLNGMIASCGAAATKFAEIGTMLGETVSLVYQTHAVAVGAILDAASVCVGLFNPFTWPDAVSGAIDTVNAAVTESMRIMGEFRRNLISLDISADGFPVPPTLPTDVGNPDAWEVQPPTAHAPDRD